MKRIILILPFLIGCVQPAIEPLKNITFPESFTKEDLKCDIKPIVIAVIDTGLKYNKYSKEARLCNFGHKDFSPAQNFSTDFGTKDPVPTDTHGHGTNIAGLITYQARNLNYCLVIIKFYDPKTAGNDNLQATIKAFSYATQIKADVINYSGGGLDYSPEEKAAVTKFLDNGGHFFAAAGNEKSDITKNPYYPAAYDYRITVVGNAREVTQEEYDKEQHRDGSRARPKVKVEGYEGIAIRSIASNYGETMMQWEFGEGQVAFGFMMTGTSQATAITTGKYIKKLNPPCKKTIDTISK